MECHRAFQRKWPPVSFAAQIYEYALTKKGFCCCCCTNLNQDTVLKTTVGNGAFISMECIRLRFSFLHTEFSLSAYKRNKRKMELAEKMDTGHNQAKKRRQSSENVSTMLSVETIHCLMASNVFFHSGFNPFLLV